MALVRDAELIEIIVDGGESAKSLQRPGMTRLLAMVDTARWRLSLWRSSTGSLEASKIYANCWSALSGAALR